MMSAKRTPDVAKIKKTHSIKVPRLYKVAAKLLKDHQRGEESVKSLAFSEDTRKRHPNIKAVYALLSESVRRSRSLDGILGGAGILEREPGLDESLARILVTELLYGKGSLPGASRPVRTVASYEGRLREAAEAAAEEDDQDEEATSLPRYARVNTLKATAEQVVEKLEEEGWEEVGGGELRAGREASFAKAAASLSPHQFLRDPLLPNVLAFPAGTSFYGHPLYSRGLVLLQDRASCMPVSALAPPPGAVVLDACAAPGMKTTQAAAAVGAAGKVYAVERSAKRCRVLRKVLSDSGADGVAEVVNADFLELDPASYPDVQHVVLDPSCSGSGMVQRGSTEADEIRLQKLSFLQAKLLAHALSFPNLRSMVYSTCSTYKEENETVLSNVFESNVASSFEVRSCLGGWTRRGERGFPFSDRVVRTDPETHLCNGFFVALIARREAPASGDATKPRKMRKKRPAAVEEDTDETEKRIDNERAVKNKKKKKKVVKETTA